MKDYIIEVTTKYKEGGYGSHWYGWSRDLYLTYDEALKLKEKLKGSYYDVQIINIKEK